jgi:hypothetical protein
MLWVEACHPCRGRNAEAHPARPLFFGPSRRLRQGSSGAAETRGFGATGGRASGHRPRQRGAAGMAGGDPQCIGGAWEIRIHDVKQRGLFRPLGGDYRIVFPAKPAFNVMAADGMSGLFSAIFSTILGGCPDQGWLRRGWGGRGRGSTGDTGFGRCYRRSRTARTGMFGVTVASPDVERGLFCPSAQTEGVPPQWVSLPDLFP